MWYYLEIGPSRGNHVKVSHYSPYPVLGVPIERGNLDLDTAAHTGKPMERERESDETCMYKSKREA